MSFIEVERSVRPGSWTMQGLHAHPHYEIYYLYQGSRQLLLANALYHMEAPSLAVIPPGAPHKTEGGPFARFNINVSPDYANPFQREGPPGPGPGCGPPLPGGAQRHVPFAGGLGALPPWGPPQRLCDTGPLWLLGGAPQPGGGRLPPGPHRGAPPAARWC